MISRILTFFLTFQFTFQGFSQNKEYVRGIIDTLSSPSFYGRGYVNLGDSITSEFIRSEYEQIGLLPYNESYFQVFNHNVNTLPGIVRLEFDDVQLKPGIEFLADPASGSGKGKVQVEEIELKDIFGTEWIEKVKKGKVISIDLTQSDSLNNREKEKVMEFIQYMKFEENIQAKALIIYQKGKQPWYVSNKQGFRSIFTVFKDSIDQKPEKVRFTTEAEYLKNYRSRNVIGYIPGTENPDTILVVSAHYDHLGMMGSQALFPGANDNASGVAMMLDMAKYFQAHPPKHTVYFIAFAGEEAGLVGSGYFVQNPVFSLPKVKVLVNLDLAGTGVDGITVVNGKIFEDEFNTLRSINEQKNYLKKVTARGDACNSDHCPFFQNGVKSFFIYTLGGTTYYHDIFDSPQTLKLNEYNNYFLLIRDFLDGIDRQ